MVLKMKLLELIPLLKDYTRIKRKDWQYFLVKPMPDCHALIKLNLYSIEISEWMPSYDDLLADDWEIIE